MSAQERKPRRDKVITKLKQNESKPIATTRISSAVQQRCLNIFKDALWTSDDDLNAVQEVKGHLYNRDFAQAFGKDHYLRAYALRWSASRALGYATIFDEILVEHLDLDFADTQLFKVLSIGGGAGAEIVGLAGCLASQIPHGGATNTTSSIHAVDIAAWSHVVERLSGSIVSPPTLSAYASAAARANNNALVSKDSFSASFAQTDVLAWSLEDAKVALSGVKVITIMFTLNELYTTSAPDTQRFLGLIKAAAEDNALLLIVDSPGSYSTVSVNGSERRYPMQWLLDLVMLKDGRASSQAAWAQLTSEDSRWFRLPDGLKYPVPLENMRYQVHVYKCPVRTTYNVTQD